MGTTTGLYLAIEGYASLWGVADLNGDVVARGAFADSLAKTGAGGVRMLHQHESRAVVGVWDEMVEDERGLRVLSGVELWEVSLVTFPMLPGARFKLSAKRTEAPDGG